MSLTQGLSLFMKPAPGSGRSLWNGPLRQLYERLWHNNLQNPMIEALYKARLRQLIHRRNVLVNKAKSKYYSGIVYEKPYEPKALW